ncbi:hypothetical protein [Roseateles chitosanitabidus]|jgi:hypothetical protein|uniref:hypothetical protein n=1 Tax=Roseateles chitosanitabidus TaxID=65048 RepID=UPI000830E046|nr:hypothetical protein [Roseateles chitosanitabidus]MBO9686910.1 hypothetical protein [Roseateles chitosanitabidus]
MNMATTRPSTGVNRSNLQSRGASSAQASREAASFAAAPRAAAAAPVPSALRDASEIVVGVVLMLSVLAALLALTLYTRDSMMVGKALSEQGSPTGSLVCKDGRIARGDDSLRDRIVEDGYFVCTDWRTQQAIELEEAQRGGRKY